MAVFDSLYLKTISVHLCNYLYLLSLHYNVMSIFNFFLNGLVGFSVQLWLKWRRGTIKGLPLHFFFVGYIFKKVFPVSWVKYTLLRVVNTDDRSVPGPDCYHLTLISACSPACLPTHPEHWAETDGLRWYLSKPLGLSRCTLNGN